MLERVQFVEVELDASISLEELSPGSTSVREAGDDLAACDSRDETQSKPQWQLTWLPKGFVFSGFKIRIHSSKLGSCVVVIPTVDIPRFSTIKP